MTPTLIGSILVLLLGPAIYFVVEKRPALLELIDGFVFVSVGGLVLMHLVPSLSDHYGAWIALAAVLGFLGPNIFERIFHRAERGIHCAALILAIVGLIIHTAVDGAAIAIGAHDHNALLPIAVIIHRLPVGLALWFIIRPRFSPLLCWGVVAVMCAATVVGYTVGDGLFTALGEPLLPVIQAFVAGSILHVVFFRVHFESHLDGEPCCSHDHPPDRPEGGSPTNSKTAESVGNILGLLLLATLLSLHEISDSEVLASHTHTHLHEGEGVTTPFLALFTSLALQSAPALVIAHLGAVFLYGFLPTGSIGWLGRGSATLQAMKGVTAGLPLPVCSCGILPFYRTLVEKGAPPAAALAFLIATPELGLDAVLISLPLLGADVTIVRVIAAFFLALFVSLILFRYIDTGPVTDNPTEPARGFTDKLSLGIRHSFIDLVDSIAPWILFGIALAAVANPLMSSIPTSLPYQLEIVLFALAGVVVYVCASGATPLAAVFIAGGVSPGAALAFLLTGPATNISTFGVLGDLHGKQFGIRFGFTTAALAILFGYIVNLFATDLDLQLSEHLLVHQFSPFEYISAGLLVILYSLSFIRLGGRGFLKEVFGRGIA